MLTKPEIQKFFTTHSIPLSGSANLSTDEYTRLVLDASAHGYSFLGFLQVACLNSDETTVTTAFENWEDLYESYCCFMTGYLIAKDQKAN